MHIAKRARMQIQAGRSKLNCFLSIRNTESHRYVKAVRHGKSGAPPRCRLMKIRRTLNFSLRSIAYIDFVRNGFAKFAYKNTLRKKIPQGKLLCTVISKGEYDR